MKIEQGFMRRELGEEETGRDEQDDPLGKAAAEQQELGPVDFLYKAVLEDGRSPTTHPLRSGGVGFGKLLIQFCEAWKS